MSVVERVRALVEPVLSDQGLELFDVELGAGRVVILVDRPGGVDLDALTAAARAISAVFDRDDPIPGGRYVLEVSSPGLERTLRSPDHFRRYVGSTVAVKLLPGLAGERRVRGVLTAADGEGFIVDGKRLPYANVERVRTVFEWGPTSRPDAKAAKSSRARSAKADRESKPSAASAPSATSGEATPGTGTRRPPTRNQKAPVS